MIIIIIMAHTNDSVEVHAMSVAPTLKIASTF